MTTVAPMLARNRAVVLVRQVAIAGRSGWQGMRFLVFGIYLGFVVM